MTDGERLARRTLPGDLSRMADLLATAFSDDPVLVHLLPLGMRLRRQRLCRYFRLEGTRSLRGGGAWTMADGGGAAMWFPPGRWNTTRAEDLRTLPAFVVIFGRRLVTAGRLRAIMAEHHPTEPHWYLHAVGVLPGRQGCGIGTVLLRPVLERCDRDGVPAYLEASTERSRTLYLRLGFRDREEPLTLPDGGPMIYPMWRDPVRP